MLAPICPCEARWAEAKGWIVGNNFLFDLDRLIKLTSRHVSLTGSHPMMGDSGSS